MQANHRVCGICGTEKPIDQFAGKRGNQCLSCVTHMRRERNGASPSSWAAYLVGQAKSNAKRRGGMECELTAEQVLDLWEQQEGLCAVSGLPMQHHSAFTDMSASIDRIDPTIGYKIENAQLVCWRVNLIKGDLHEAQLLWWLRVLVAHETKKHRRSSKKA